VPVEKKLNRNPIDLRSPPTAEWITLNTLPISVIPDPRIPANLEINSKFLNIKNALPIS
jgi:hypothetical protein